MDIRPCSLPRSLLVPRATLALPLGVGPRSGPVPDPWGAHRGRLPGQRVMDLTRDQILELLADLGREMASREQQEREQFSVRLQIW